MLRTPRNKDTSFDQYESSIIDEMVDKSAFIQEIVDKIYRNDGQALFTTTYRIWLSGSPWW